MESYNTTDLIKELSEKFQVDKSLISDIILEIQKIIKREIFKGRKFKLRFVGSFSLHRLPDKTHKGFGKKFNIKNKNKLKFIPSKEIMSRTSFSELNRSFDE